MIDMTSTRNMLDDVRARCAADRAEFAGAQVDQSVRDREYLLALIDARK